MSSSAPALKSPIDRFARLNVQPFSQPISNRAIWRIVVGTLVLSDLLMTGFAYRLAYFIRFELGLSIFQPDAIPSIEYYARVVGMLLPFQILVFAANGLYLRKNLFGGTREYASLFTSITISSFGLILISFFEPNFVLSRGWLLLSWLLAFLITLVTRFSIRRMIYQLRRHGYFLAPSLVVGGNQEARMIAEQLLDSPATGLHLLGFVSDKYPSGTHLLKNINVLGPLEHLPEIVSYFGVEEIIIATSALKRDEVVTIFKDYGISNGVNLRLSSGLFEIITTGLQVKELGFVPLVSVNRFRMAGMDRILKLMLDYSLTIPGLILLSPVLILLAIAIKLDSPGPVLHRRRVMGVNGNQFDAFKFRTMHTDGDEILASHPELQEELAKYHKLKHDPRVTRIGEILRKFSLDEIPQLINVLRGEMSLVGPRMISPEEMAEYNQWGINLLTVRPGLTGLWQVSGRSDLSYKDRVRLDMYYIRNWTIWLDLQLLWQTLPAVIKAAGAY